MDAITVLNVDDTVEQRYAITRTLIHAGFQVEEAGTGAEALTLAQKCPDVILLDVNLPDVSGIEVCRTLRASEGTSNIPIIHLSAMFVDSAHRIQGLDNGADAYITQPFNPDELIATIKATLRVRRAEEHRDALISELKAKNAALKKIEWLLSSPTDAANERLLHRSKPQAYGDLTKLNQNRLLLDSVGTEVLSDITADYLDVLESSSAIYENNGDYAVGAFSSGWCRFLDSASRRLCQTDDNREALSCGKWLCHESCWGQASKASIESGREVDIECAGGIRLNAVPIRAGNEIVGSINLGYGDPPNDELKLKEIAEKYQVSIDELRKRSAEYETRPPYIVEMAKRRLRTSAKLIGEIVQRKRAEQAAIRSEKLAGVGRMAATVAHEINNPLTAVINSVFLATSDPALPESARPHLRTAERELQRVAHIAKQTLGFYREHGKAKRFELHATTDELLELFNSKIQHQHVSVDRRYPQSRLTPIHAVHGEIRQALSNILGNALDAMSKQERGTLHIRVSEITGLDGKRLARVTIADTGVGMTAAHKKRIFEPFFTTKESVGTGLGLWVTRQLIKRNGGLIRVRSKAGCGTVFSLFFPVAHQEQPCVLRIPASRARSA